MSLVLHVINHPACRSNQVSFFRDQMKACKHMDNHLLSSPECMAWKLVSPGISGICDIEDGQARWRFSRDMHETVGANAQELYNLYLDASEEASRDASKQGWIILENESGDETTHLALGLNGVVLVLKEDAVVTSFLPAQGLPSIVKGSSTGERSRRDTNMKPARRRARHVREERAREERMKKWDEETRLYYDVFRPAVQFIRQVSLDGYDMNGKRTRAGNYGQLRNVLPSMKKLNLESWKGLRPCAVQELQEQDDD